MRYGNGTICKRKRLNKNGTIYTYWQARYYENGKQHTLTSKTKADCLKRLKEVTQRLKPKNYKKNITYEAWLKLWYENYKKPFISTSTKSSYKVCIKNHITKEFKNLNLKSINSLDIMKCLNTIKKPRQKEITKNIIVASLRNAFKNNYINNRCFENIILKKCKSKERKILLKKDEQKLLAILDNECKNAVICYLNTGCRLSELFNINENDIDRKANTIHIRGTKTTNSDRYIPLLPKIKNLLPLNISIKKNTLQHRFKDATKKLNLNLSIHDLRHTFATRCAEKGVNIKIVQKWLGHSKYSTTADIYTHLTSEFEKQEIDKLLN